MGPKRKADGVAQAATAGKKIKKGDEKTSTTATSPSGTASGTLDLSSLITEPGWKAQLEPYMAQPTVTDLEAKLQPEYAGSTPIYPPKHLIFNAFNLTPLDQVKVVILGQDPYHGPGQANGLSFSVGPGVKVPPSLVNIYKELCLDIPGFTTPPGGGLEKWADQGVFLLNAALTVQQAKPNSHAKMWQKFTDHVIQLLSSQLDKVVFILWGNFAHKKAASVDTKKHSVIKTAHPSPLSFNKFRGCKCFSQANTALQNFGKTPIDWRLT